MDAMCSMPTTHRRLPLVEELEAFGDTDEQPYRLLGGVQVLLRGQLPGHEVP